VAQAVVDLLSRNAGEIDITCIDALDFAPGVFRMYYAGGFATAMSKFPRPYGLGFHLTNRPDRPRRGLMERRRLWCERLCLRRLAGYLGKLDPSLIVNTHFLPAPMIGRMIRRGQIRCPQMVIVTDICMHRFWYAENVARWFVPCELPAASLRRWGVSAENITVSGIPVHAKWTQPLDRQAILADWRLPADRPIVALSAGTEFTCGPLKAIAGGLLKECEDSHLIVLLGRNQKLAAKLSSLPEAAQRMTLVPYTNRVHELIEASSLMVTKAGGITTAECLAKAKPMVLLKPVPGHEAGNASYLESQGAAVIAKSHKRLPALVKRLLADGGELGRLSSNARRLYRPAAQTIVNSILQAVSRQADAPAAEVPPADQSLAARSRTSRL
jgi:processive 1,2-diacylglycerol beta-glucosyltransferase